MFLPFLTFIVDWLLIESIFIRFLSVLFLQLWVLTQKILTIFNLNLCKFIYW